MILVIEDDSAIRRGLFDYLTLSGFEAAEAACLAEATSQLESRAIDLVLLDLVLPDGSGLDWLDWLRSRRPALPVIILTALGEERQRVAGLNRGADDYVVKPFSLKELRARISAVLRRAPRSAEAQPKIQISDRVTLDADCRCLIADSGETVALTEKESAALRYLAAHANRVVGRDELLRQVWGIEAGAMNTRTVDICIARLREKLPSDVRLTTKRGQGYALEK